MPWEFPCVGDAAGGMEARVSSIIHVTRKIHIKENGGSHVQFIEVYRVAVPFLLLCSPCIVLLVNFPFPYIVHFSFVATFSVIVLPYFLLFSFIIFIPRFLCISFTSVFSFSQRLLPRIGRVGTNRRHRWYVASLFRLFKGEFPFIFFILELPMSFLFPLERLVGCSRRGLYFYRKKSIYLVVHSCDLLSI